jgi:hypothetical protein
MASITAEEKEKKLPTLNKACGEEISLNSSFLQITKYKK